MPERQNKTKSITATPAYTWRICSSLYRPACDTIRYDMFSWCAKSWRIVSLIYRTEPETVNKKLKTKQKPIIYWKKRAVW